jgi:hypothetical protein
MNRVPATCLLAADIAGDVGFYTNAVLGLRTEKKAIDYLDWNRHPDFCQFCGDFLRFQLETMMPRLPDTNADSGMVAISQLRELGE